MGFPKRRFAKKRAEPKAPLPPVNPVSEVTGVLGLRVDGQRLDALDRPFLQVVCDCGHSGEVPVAALLKRHGRATRVRDALGAIRCSRCNARAIRRVYAIR